MTKYTRLDNAEVIIQEYFSGEVDEEEYMKYDVILADPPWRYGKTVGQGIAEDHYPTMSIEEICSLPVKELAADNCALFLWTTPPTLFEYAPLVFKSWRFRPVTKAFCWVKSKRSGFGFWYGIGHYTASNTEDCWLGIKGKMPRAGCTTQIIYAPVGEHSRKPDDQYRKIEALYPDVRYCELFARQKREGWDSWGNEVVSDFRLEKN